jgi:hypothetical protein
MPDEPLIAEATTTMLARVRSQRFLTTRALDNDSATRLRSLLLGQPGMEQPFQMERVAPPLFHSGKNRPGQDARRFAPPKPLPRPIRWQSPRM